MAPTFPLSGIIPAIFTAYDDNGELDPKRQARFVRHLLGTGVNALFVGGTTGEFCLLSLDERESLLEGVISEVSGAVPIVSMVGAHDTRSSVRLARHAKKLGATAICALPPLYYGYKERNILDHFSTVAAATDLPLYVYHIPIRTGIPLTPSLMEGLLKIPTVTGIKFSDANVFTLWQILNQADGKIQIFAGFDELVLPALTMGAAGGIGSTHNFLSPVFLDLLTAWKGGHVSQAQELQDKANRIIEVTLKWDNSLSSGKAAMELLGLPLGDPRPPLRRFSREEKQAFAKDMVAAGFSPEACG